MRTRKMWADTDWSTNTGGAYFNSRRVHTSVPVLVTDASDMPYFEPGDRVRTAAATDVLGSPVAWHEYEIAHIYFDGERWCFYSTDRTRHPLAKYTKIPRKTSVLLKLTGETAESCAQVIEGWKGVRVERVEDPDE